MTSPLFLWSSDERIIDLMEKGDEEALVMLYRANKRMVMSFVTKNSGTSDDAEDLLQDAVVTLWERVRSRKFERTSKLSTFIYAVVQNKWRRRLAAMKREVTAELNNESVPSTDPGILENIIESERTKAIAAALVKVGEPCKTLLLLFYWEEKSMEEIARHMKFANADTVKSKKYQCKKALEKILSDERII